MPYFHLRVHLRKKIPTTRHLVSGLFERMSTQTNFRERRFSLQNPLLAGAYRHLSVDQECIAPRLHGGDQAA